jgi:tetratricopeptide (TPR) repeat protein
LLLTYFEDPRPKQSTLIRDLALGQSTFYRQLGAAVEAFERAVIAQLQPSLRLEQPAARALIGRDAVLREITDALSHGGVVTLIGPSGIGKTSLGATVCQSWPAAPARTAPNIFWYTFRPGLTDNLHHLIFSLALFLHQHGVSNLWLQLIAQAPDTDFDAGKAMAIIRNSLEALRISPSLLCFDEVDLLLPSDLDDSETHQQLRSFLEDLATSPRGGAPMLCIGQRLVLEPERNRTFVLTRFALDETRALFAHARVEVDDTVCAAAQQYTRGNPLLLQLLLTLHHLGEPVLTQLSQLSASVSIDWYLARMRRHLSAKEQDVLDALCVFETPAPAALWRKHAKTIERLIALNLLEKDASEALAMPQALREALYRQLPADLRVRMHLSAADVCAAHAAYTLAAHHYVRGERPELAIWIWHTHRDAEIRQGQAQTALRIFEPLSGGLLTNEQDRRALALLLAELAYLRGRHEMGLEALGAVSWKPAGAATARAQHLRGKLLARRGDIDAAITAYRGALDNLDGGPSARPVSLRTDIAGAYLVRARDATKARREAQLARIDVEVLLANIEDEAGDLVKADAHLRTALEMAQGDGDSRRLARIHELLGILAARRADADTAERHLIEASQQYEAHGDLIRAVGMSSSNIAFAYLMARRYADAIAPAQRAVEFYQAMAQPYELALNEANMAEAYANLGDAVNAEAHVQRALAQEEAVVRSQCLYVLGHVSRMQRRFADAECLCREALACAEEHGDPWAKAYALRTLAETHRDAGDEPRALEVFEASRAVFQALGHRLEAEHVSQQLRALSPHTVTADHKNHEKP